MSKWSIISNSIWIHPVLGGCVLADQKLFTYFNCGWTSIVKAWLKVQNRPPLLNAVVVWKEQKPELITSCKRSCREGNVFTGICHSVHGRGVVVPYPPIGPDPPPRDQTPSRKDTGPDRKWHHTPPPGTTKAGGTHPTEMVSYW